MLRTTFLKMLAGLVGGGWIGSKMPDEPAVRSLPALADDDSWHPPAVGIIVVDTSPTEYPGYVRLTDRTTGDQVAVIRCKPGRTAKLEIPVRDPEQFDATFVGRLERPQLYRRTIGADAVARRHGLEV